MPLPLPCLYRLTWIYELEHIEGQIVTDPPEGAELKDDDDSDEHPYLEEPGPEEAESHHEDIAGGVEDGVTEVAESDSGFTVSIDDER